MLKEIHSSNKSKTIEKNSFVKNNIINPLINSSYVTSADVVENIANTVSEKLVHKKVLEVTKSLNVNQAKPYSAAWFAQNVSSALGAFVPYAVAGIVTHSITSEASLASGVELSAQADKTLMNMSMIAGSGVVGYFGPKVQNESRLANSISTMASFSVFMGGNELSSGLKLPARILANASTGLIGGAVGSTTTDLIDNHKLPSLNNVLASGVSGATLNSLLPFASEMGLKSIKSLNIDTPSNLKLADSSDTTIAASHDSSLSSSNLNFRNSEIAKFFKDNYSKSDLENLAQALKDHKTTFLRRYESGGQSAVTITDEPSLESAIGGLLALQWDRDNIMQALTEYQISHDSNLSDKVNFDKDAWKKGLAASLKYQMNHQSRITDIIDGKTSGYDVSARPHIRYNGVTLEDVNDPWGNAQNDALASINFMLFHALNDGNLKIDDPTIAPYASQYASLLPNYFKTVHVWEDWDFGAWEDKRAEHASSIGMALASLREQKQYIDKNGPLSYETNGKTYSVNSQDLQTLITNCESKLKSLLPNEFTRSDDGSVRPVDAALINPLYLSAISKRPLLDDNMNSTIINNIQDQLMGNIGSRRYPGDVWDGRTNRYELPPDMAAQWTHVSPMISYVLSDMYDRTHNSDYLKGQIFHFNRGLADIDTDWKIPEAYIRNSDNTKWIADDNKPLAWSQSAFLSSLSQMYKRAK